MTIQLNPGIFNKAISISLLVLLSLLYSCSGNESATNKAKEDTQTVENKSTENTSGDACSLITEDEAKVIIGGAVKKAVSTGDMCQYLDASDKISASAFVSIQLNYGGGSGYDSYIASSERNFNAKAKPIAGVGDKAFFIAGQLIVLAGQHFMTVWVGKEISEEQVIAAEKSVALKAVERLGN